MAFLVSVVIPTFNRSALLERAVRSVAAQTERNVEILICDDGSTDNSRDRILALGDSRIRWVDGLRGGRPAIPRNRGLQCSNGEWVAFLDSDDEWQPNKLETQLDAVRGLAFGGCCSNAWIEDKFGRRNKKYFEASKTGVLDFYMMLSENKVICSSMLLRREAINEKRFPEEMEYIGVEDYAFWLTIFRSVDILYLDIPLLSYSIQTENSVRKEQQIGIDVLRKRMILSAIGEGLVNLELRNLSILFSFVFGTIVRDISRRIGGTLHDARRAFSKIAGIARRRR